MKKTMIILALAVMLLFVGCDQVGIDIRDGDTPGAKGPDATPLATPGTDAAPDGEQSSPDQSADIGELTDADFTVTVEGVSFTIGADPAAIIDTFGDGGADENNNFGFIGWDDTETYKYFRHDYDGFSIAVKTHAAEGTSEISQIGLTGVGTSRGVAPGDSREDMVARYGEPGEEKSDEGMTDCTYRSGDRTIIFVLNDSGTIGFINID